MEIERRTILSLLGCLILHAFCSVAIATPPQMGNPLLRTERDQMAHALGESSPKVIAADARMLLEGRSRRTVAYRKVPNSSDPESQLEEIVKALNASSRENRKLKKRIQGLESSLQAYERNNSQSK